MEQEQNEMSCLLWSTVHCTCTLPWSLVFLFHPWFTRGNGEASQPSDFTSLLNVLFAADRAGGTQNGGYSAVDNRQRLLAEEAELDRMVKELQATLPPSEGQLLCEFEHCPSDLLLIIYINIHIHYIYKVVCALSNSATFDDLEWPRTPVSSLV